MLGFAQPFLAKFKSTTNSSISKQELKRYFSRLSVFSFTEKILLMTTKKKPLRTEALSIFFQSREKSAKILTRNPTIAT